MRLSKSFRVVFYCIGVLSLVGCLPMGPVLDTARTEPGFSVGGGVTYHDVLTRSEGWDVSWDSIPDTTFTITGDTSRFGVLMPPFALGYGFNDEFSLVGRLTVPLELDVYPLLEVGSTYYPVPCALGVKLSSSEPVFNYAARLEASFPHLFIFTPMIGFSDGYEGYEIFTLGVQLAPIQYDAFLIVRPFRNLNLFAGVSQGVGGMSASEGFADGSGFYSGSSYYFREFYAGLSCSFHLLKK